jgi:MFS superfamily sulfate permease-like transporter
MNQVGLDLMVSLHCISQEGIAIGRKFATLKDYRLDGNKEILSFGIMNIIGSLTSCYTATG